MLCDLLNHYSADAMGNQADLPSEVLERIGPGLSAYPTAFSYFAIDTDINQAVGLVNCFESFSTFKAKPVVNIHDLIVHQNARGKGIGKLLLKAAENEALKRGACKLTLEVLEGNPIAQGLYRKFGFESYSLTEETGRALFMEKNLN